MRVCVLRVYIYLYLYACDACTIRRVFELCWKAVKPWLNENTLSKIVILGADYQTTLKSNIPLANLPSIFGGTCTCADKGGSCIEQIDPDAGMTSVTVGARATHVVDVVIDAAELGMNERVVCDTA